MKNLRNVRKECNLTQKQIAELLNISQQSYSDYENEKTQPDFETLIRIADALNVSIDYLLGRTDELGGVVAPPLSHTVPELSRDEKKLLDNFRAMRPDLQAVCLNMSKTLLQTPNSITEKTPNNRRDK